VKTATAAGGDVAAAAAAAAVAAADGGGVTEAMVVVVTGSLCSRPRWVAAGAASSARTATGSQAETVT